MRLPTRLLQRKVKTHKGDYGHILILAGSSRFSGAALLCSQAAMRCGAGLVTLGVPISINLGIIRSKLKEVMSLPLEETRDGTLSLLAFTKISTMLKRINVLIIGPGLGENKSTYALIRKVISSCEHPMVIDADALNALNNNLGILKRHVFEIVLTPHEKEISRLFNLSMQQVRKRRILIAQKYAKYYNSVIILKGHNSIVANPNGKSYINKSGNPGMATAGSGDVLSGVVGGFLAQGLDAFTAAKYATFIHGLAGDIAAKDKTQMGLIASDIINRIPDALKMCS